jgi:hypothetical protein
MIASADTVANATVIVIVNASATTVRRGDFDTCRALVFMPNSCR